MWALLLSTRSALLLVRHRTACRALSWCAPQRANGVFRYILAAAAVLWLLFVISKRTGTGLKPIVIQPNQLADRYAVVIRDATVFDGTGGPRKEHHDVAIDHKGKVVAIAPHPMPGRGDKEVDAQGMWVVPGLVDIHCHYDVEIEACAALSESLRHGVTLAVMGNCSLSASIGNERDLIDIFSRVENLPSEILETWLKNKVVWKSVSEYYQHVDALPLGINVATFLGHSALRIYAMGLERSLEQHDPTEEEMARMLQVMEEAMQAGYTGLSVDLLPWHRMSMAPYTGVSVPSQQARYKEYVALASVVRKYDRVLQATPAAGDKKTALFLYLLSSGVLFGKALRTTILAAMDVKSLSAPFLLFSDGLKTPISEELQTGCEALNADEKQRRAMFADADFRARFRAEWHPFSKEHVFHCDLADMWIVDAPDKALVGKSFEEAACGGDPLEFFMDMLAKHGDDIRWKTVVANHRPEVRRQLLKHPHLLPGFNDSGAHNRNMGFQDGALVMLQDALLHPEWMSFEHAVVRLTSEPCQWLGMDRGVLAPGWVADMVVLDPEKLRTHDFSVDPHFFSDPDLGVSRMVKRSDGVVRDVIVGGRFPMEDYEFADDLGEAKYGALLRSTHSRA